MSDIKKSVSTLILCLAGVIVLLAYYIEIPILTVMSSELKRWAVILSACAFGLGLISFTKHHYIKTVKREQDWFLSAWALILLFVTIILGIMPPIAERTEFTWIYNTVILPLTNTTLSLFTFFIIAATFRTFRPTNKKSLVFALSGVFILFKNAPITNSAWSGFREIGQWILSVPNNAGFRAFIICTAFGVLSWSLRTLIGMERGVQTVSGGSED